jgi:uncharacterized cupredoxin-like copper-binding protein
MTRFRFGLLALSALLAIGTWTALSSGSAFAQASTRMTVTLLEYQILSERMDVPAGEVVFDVVNTGEEVHELVVVKSDLDIAALPPSSVNDEVDETAIGQFIDGVENVQPATGTEKRMTLSPGRYILLCNLTGHYKGGMVGTLQVN